MEIEEICLQCGKLVDDGRPYCSEECAKFDASSTSSSAFSSPHFDPLTNALPDVPTLMPSALGSVLRKATYGRYAAPSSAWSQVSDDDEDRIYLQASPDDEAKSPTSRPRGLMYARQPSTTNRPSTLSTSHPHSQGHPRIIPSRARNSSTDDDSGSSSSPRSPRTYHRLQPAAKAAPSIVSPSQATPSDTGATPTAVKKRNRASLPAYFQLLAVSPTPSAAAFSPKLPLSRRNSQGSLPTPTVAAPPSNPSTATMHERAAAERGRGRRREVGEPSAVSRTRSGRGSSNDSPRRRRSPPLRGMYEADESELEFEFEFDGRPEALERGRSPAAIPRDCNDRRGRWNAENDGVDPSDPYAPGFGNGRSGLRGRASREPYGRSHRSPMVAYP